MNILLIEDDTLLAEGLEMALTSAGYAVTWATTLGTGQTCLDTGAFDLLLLDLGLPDGDGVSLIRSMRSDGHELPVLVLTARDGVAQRVTALDAGADDYMEKPFDLKELEARLRALLRRGQANYGRHYQLGPLSLSPFSREVRIDGKLQALPVREYEILEALMRRANTAVSKSSLAQRLTHNNEDIRENAVEVYIHRLRRRLSPIDLEIRTLRGVGYVLEISAVAAK